MTIAQALQEAESAADAKDWSRAVAALSEAGDSTAVLEKRAFYLSRDGHHDEATAVLEVLAAREPANHLWPYMIAYQLYAQERYEESVPWFRTALQLNPRHLKSWWRAANALDKSGQEAAAVRCAQRLLALWQSLPKEAQDRERKTLAKACYYLGKVRMRRDPHGAIPLLEQALANDPQDAYKHYRLGKALHYAGRAAEALSHLERAAKLKRGDVSIEVELADVSAITGDTARALTLLRGCEGRLMGYLLRKAARTAMRSDDALFALRLYRKAARDRTFLDDESLQTELQAVEEKARELGLDPDEPTRNHGERVNGRIKMVNAERNFGFVIDDEGGTSRHFRLNGQTWRRGERVSYLTGTADKGPNASELQQR